MANFSPRHSYRPFSVIVIIIIIIWASFVKCCVIIVMLDWLYYCRRSVAICVCPSVVFIHKWFWRLHLVQNIPNRRKLLSNVYSITNKTLRYICGVPVLCILWEYIIVPLLNKVNGSFVSQDSWYHTILFHVLCDKNEHGLVRGITYITSHNANPIGSELSMPPRTQLTPESKEFGDHPLYKNVGEDPQIALACGLHIYAPTATDVSRWHMQSGRTLVSMSTEGHH